MQVGSPFKAGDGIVFDAGKPEQKEEGGRVYDLRINGRKIEGEGSGMVEIVPGRHDVNLRKVRMGDKIWKTNDPELDRRLRKTFETDHPYRLFPLVVEAEGKEGMPLTTRWLDKETGHQVEIISDNPLEKAMKRPLTVDYLKEQWGRLGGTVYQLENLRFLVEEEVIIPVKELNRMRREAVERLTLLRQQPPRYQKNTVIFKETHVNQSGGKGKAPRLMVLCRTLAQIEAAADTPVDEIYADFEFVKDFPQAVQLAKSQGKRLPWLPHGFICLGKMDF